MNEVFKIVIKHKSGNFSVILKKPTTALVGFYQTRLCVLNLAAESLICCPGGAQIQWTLLNNVTLFLKHDRQNTSM